MAYNCVVLIKQVPDTKRITGDVMNDDGTVNLADAIYTLLFLFNSGLPPAEPFPAPGCDLTP